MKVYLFQVGKFRAQSVSKVFLIEMEYTLAEKWAQRQTDWWKVTIQEHTMTSSLQIFALESIYFHLLQYYWITKRWWPQGTSFTCHWIKRTSKNGSVCKLEPTHWTVFTNLDNRKLLTNTIQSVSIEMRTATGQQGREKLFSRQNSKILVSKLDS